MGWTIKRPDGTYRVWNANTQDDLLEPGELWEERPSPPPMPILDPRPTKAQIQAAIGSATTLADLKAVLLQLIQRVN